MAVGAIWVAALSVTSPTQHLFGGLCSPVSSDHCVQTDAGIRLRSPVKAGATTAFHYATSWTYVRHGLRLSFLQSYYCYEASCAVATKICQPVCCHSALRCSGDRHGHGYTWQTRFCTSVPFYPRRPLRVYLRHHSCGSRIVVANIGAAPAKARVESSLRHCNSSCSRGGTIASAAGGASSVWPSYTT